MPANPPIHPRTATDTIADPRLDAARAAFLEAHRVLERARDDLMRAHALTSRLWTSTR